MAIQNYDDTGIKDHSTQNKL